MHECEIPEQFFFFLIKGTVGNGGLYASNSVWHILYSFCIIKHSLRLEPDSSRTTPIKMQPHKGLYL